MSIVINTSEAITDPWSLPACKQAEPTHRGEPSYKTPGILGIFGTNAVPIAAVPHWGPGASNVA